MGVTLKIGGYPFPVQSWQITEDSIPLAANDTTGSTGRLTATLKAPDPNLEHVQNTGMKWVLDFGYTILQGKSVEFVDSRWGSITGTVASVSRPSPATISITANVLLNRLNAFNVRALPFSGKLGNLIRYYVRLGDPEATFNIDSSLESRTVSAPGWNGELWYYMKMLAMAHEFDVSTVEGVYTFRRLRQRELAKGLDISIAGDAPVPNLAQTIEVYRYNNRAITNELVYPPGGWNTSTEVLNVNAGEVSEYTLQLSASVSSIQTPTLQTMVDPDYDASSVFTIVANDGFPVSNAQWVESAGSVKVRINEDTTSLTVTLRGATRVPLATGGFASNFSLALASDDSGSRYSTLRIVGTGVAFEKEKTVIRTGATERDTGTVVGVTIDNPFLSDKNQQYRAGTRAAAQFVAPIPNRAGQVVSAVMPPGTNLGNVGGMRVFDKDTQRPYRVRSSTFSPATLSYNAEDDLLHDDVEGRRAGLTYSQVQEKRQGLTYLDDFLMGLR